MLLHHRPPINRARARVPARPGTTAPLREIATVGKRPRRCVADERDRSPSINPSAQRVQARGVGKYGFAASYARDIRRRTASRERREIFDRRRAAPIASFTYIARAFRRERDRVLFSVHGQGVAAVASKRAILSVGTPRGGVRRFPIFQYEPSRSCASDDPKSGPCRADGAFAASRHRASASPGHRAALAVGTPCARCIFRARDEPVSYAPAVRGEQEVEVWARRTRHEPTTHATARSATHAHRASRSDGPSPGFEQMNVAPDRPRAAARRPLSRAARPPLRRARDPRPARAQPSVRERFEPEASGDFDGACTPRRPFERTRNRADAIRSLTRDLDERRREAIFVDRPDDSSASAIFPPTVVARELAIDQNVIAAFEETFEKQRTSNAGLVDFERRSLRLDEPAVQQPTACRRASSPRLDSASP